MKIMKCKHYIGSLKVGQQQEAENGYEVSGSRNCCIKIPTKVCVFGNKWLLFGKNWDMQILIEKEYFSVVFSLESIVHI